MVQEQPVATLSNCRCKVGDFSEIAVVACTYANAPASRIMQVATYNDYLIQDAESIQSIYPASLLHYDDATLLAHNKKDPQILQIPHQKLPSKTPMPTHISNIREM